MTEEQVHLQVCAYIRAKYPKVMFNTDLSGIRLTMGLAKKVKNMRSNKGFPDLVIYEPKQGWKACFIELKKDGIRLLKRDGSFVNEHIEYQNKVIEALKERGYYATFAIGFDDAKYIIDKYLSYK